MKPCRQTGNEPKAPRGPDRERGRQLVVLFPRRRLRRDANDRAPSASTSSPRRAALPTASRTSRWRAGATAVRRRHGVGRGGDSKRKSERPASASPGS